MKRRLFTVILMLIALPVFAGYEGDIEPGATGVMFPVFMYATDGTAKTGLAFGDVTITYKRFGVGGQQTAVTEASTTLDSHTDGGWVEHSAANGLYQFQSADAAFASGATGVMFTFSASATVPRTVIFGLDGKIGSPVALDGGRATITGMLTKMVDDNGGADFDAELHSLEALRNALDASARSNNVADDGDIVTGTDTANAYTDTYTANDVAWQIAGASAVGGFGINTSFTFNLGTDKHADFVTLRAKESQIGVVHVWAYNYQTSSFDQISYNGNAINGVSYDDYGPFILLDAHQRASDGEVILRLTGAGTAANKYLWVDMINLATGGAGALTANDIAEAVAAHDVKPHTNHDALAFRVSLSMADEYPITTADTALSFTCSSLPAVTDRYKLQSVRIHDVSDTVNPYHDSWIESMTNTGVVTLGRALTFTPEVGDELFVMGNLIEMRGTDDAAPAATALTDVTWTDTRAGYLDELASGNLPTDIADIPTVAEFNARTILSATYATSASLAAVDTVVDAIKVTTDKLDDTLEDDGGTYRFTENALEEAPSGAGSGAIQFDWTQKTSTGTPIAQCFVWITTDALGNVFVGSDYTDNFGVATFYVDAGTYYVWRQKSGFNFTNPQTEVVP